MLKYVKQTVNGAMTNAMEVSPEMFEMLVHPSPIVWEEATKEEFESLSHIGHGTGEGNPESAEAEADRIDRERGELN